MPLVSDVGRPATTNVIPSRPADTQSLESALDMLGGSSLVNPEKNYTSGKSITTTTTKCTTTMSILWESLGRQQALICPLSEQSCLPRPGNSPTSEQMMRNHLRFVPEQNRACRKYNASSRRKQADMRIVIPPCMAMPVVWSCMVFVSPLYSTMLHIAYLNNSHPTLQINLLFTAYS